MTKGTPPEYTLDYTLKWNPTVSSTSNLVTYTSQTAFDAAVCSMYKTNSVPSTSVFINNNSTGYATSNDKITSGVTITGVLLFSDLSGESVDPYYP